MKDFEKTLEIINKFFKIQADENYSNSLFLVLKELIDFESGYIFYTNPERLEYSYNPKITKISELKGVFLKESLTYKNTEFGLIAITGKHFTTKDKNIFKACASIISNITKDFEISKIIKMQLKSMEKINSDIRKSEKIKTEFLSNMSHELRTPLNSILGFADLLDGEFIGRLNEKQKEYVNDIKISAIHLLEMVNDILDISKIESGILTLNLKEFSPSQAISEVINILKPLLIEKNITLSTEIDDNIIVKADYRKFQQVVFNLTSNAIKYTPEKGHISISINNKKNKTILCIEDNGIGIEKKYHKKIFEKFEQIGEHKNSTGLGLSITKELVNMHNGRIILESEPFKGTKFTIIFP